MQRTTSFSVCVPPIPPCPATTGRKMARVTTRAMVFSNKLMIAAAMNVVTRLMESHGKRS
jgi:hypothetical protein